MRSSFVRFVVVIAFALTAAGAVAEMLSDVSGAFNSIAAFPDPEIRHDR